MKLTNMNPLRPFGPILHFRPIPSYGHLPQFQPPPPCHPAGTAGHLPHFQVQKWGGRVLLALCGLMLAGCAGPVLTPTLTPTATVSPTPTATVIWFPPTSTPTDPPVQQPSATVDDHPGMGDLLFSDSFDDPAFWNTAGSADASAILANNRLVLSITQPGPLSIASRRDQPSAGDFYAEATANLSLCSGIDQYGMLFRAGDSADYYRFALTCNGQERLDRVRAGVTYPLVNWLSSNDVPLAAPAQIKLGVWAVGGEIRLFLNDNYQFSMSDPVFSSGGFGFFAYASGKSPVTISFSGLSVYSVSYILPTPSPVPSLTPHPTDTRQP